MSDNDNIVDIKTPKSKKDPFDSALTTVASKAMAKGAKRTTEDLFAKAEELGVDPFVILLNIADGNKLALDLDAETDKPISPELRAMAAREILKYMYPTMKSAEISGPGGLPLPPQIVKILFEGEDRDDNQLPKEIK